MITTQTCMLRAGLHREVDIANLAARAAKLPGRVAFRVEFVPAGPATLEQNSGVWKLYALIAGTLGDRTARDVKRECKLCHGVPLLREADADYRSTYDAVLKPLTYEQKLVAMDYWPVTRLMSKAQKSAYLDDVQRQYGVYLEAAA